MRWKAFDQAAFDERQHHAELEDVENHSIENYRADWGEDSVVHLSSKELRELLNQHDGFEYWMLPRTHLPGRRWGRFF